MFDFLKRKKEFPDIPSEENDEVKGLESSDLTAGLSPIEPQKPEIFGSEPVIGGRDIDLIITKIELLNRKLEDIEKKLGEVLEIARQSK